MDVQKFKSDVDFVVRIGGEGGEGVISCGELFAQARNRHLRLSEHAEEAAPALLHVGAVAHRLGRRISIPPPTGGADGSR